MCAGSFNAVSDALACPAALVWGGAPDLLRRACAVLLAGAAVKLVDGAVDGEPGWDAAACAAYAAVLVAAAAGLHAPWAASLVSAAWALGMAGASGRRGVAEAAAVVGAAGLLVGWRVLAASLAALLAVQMADRIQDREGWPGDDPWRRLATGLVALGALCAAVALDPLLAGLVVFLTPAAEGAAFRLGRRRPAAAEVSWVWSS